MRPKMSQGENSQYRNISIQAGIRELAYRDRGIRVMGQGTVLSLDAGPLARFAGSGDAQHSDLP